MDTLNRVLNVFGFRKICVSLSIFIASFSYAQNKVNPRVVTDVLPISSSEYMSKNKDMAILGQALFFDKELSGNRNISCATCHSPMAATSDGLSINLGEGAIGLSVARSAGTYPPKITDPLERGQRNAPALFDRGATDFTTLMHDGRIAGDGKGGFVSPAGNELPQGFDHLLEVSSIFAFTENQEMLGQAGENDMADAAAMYKSNFTPVWIKVVERIKAQAGYHTLINKAFPELKGNLNDFGIVHVGKSIAQYQVSSFSSSEDNPFDRYLKGDKDAISKQAIRGYKVFTEKGQCSQCHNGPFLSDQKFHAIGIPQIGPGFGGVGINGREDFGREGETKDIGDRYKFRTPPLRNVAITGPWGHDGAYKTLEGIVKHHLSPKSSLFTYDISQATLPSRYDLDQIDFVVTKNSATTMAIGRAITLDPIRLSSSEVVDLMAFLHALTDPKHLDLRSAIPAGVPSGLPLAD